jgi:hypothetical protein
MGVHRSGVERTLDAQRPEERPASLCGAQALRVGMQPGAPSRKLSPRIGDKGPVGRYHAKQSGGRRPDAATHARSYRTFWLMIRLRPCADRPMTTGHCQV